MSNTAAPVQHTLNQNTVPVYQGHIDMNYAAAVAQAQVHPARVSSAPPVGYTYHDQQILPQCTGPAHAFSNPVMGSTTPQVAYWA